MLLFDDKIRSFDGPKLKSKSYYEFIDASSRNDVSLLRVTMNQWFSRFPLDEQADLQARLRKDEKFQDSFFELYLHEIFLCMGFRLEPHPDMIESTRHPDFLATKNNIEFIIEAKVDYNASENERATKRMIDSVLDGINRIKSHNFMLILHDLDILTSTTPSQKGFVDHIENLLESLDYLQIRKQTLHSISDLHQYNYKDAGLRISFSVMAIDDKNDISNANAIGIDSSNKVQWIDSASGLIKSFEKKASRYGRIAMPYLICINALDLFIDEHDVLNAALGRLKNNIYLAQDSDKWIVGPCYRERNGFFSTDRYSQVSAVLIFNLSVGTTGHARYWFIHNPFASFPLEPKDISLDSFAVTNEGFVKVREGIPLHEILGIPPSWRE